MSEVNADSSKAYAKSVRLLHNPVTAWVILFFSLGLTFIGWYLSNSFLKQIAKDRFEFRSVEIVNGIKERMSVYEQVLRGCAAFFTANPNVSRQQWQRYITSLDIDRHWPGIQGLGYAVPVLPSEKESFTQLVRSEGFPEFSIKPEGQRPYYTSIVYLEPFDWRNQRAFGFDMWSNDMRKTAMQRAQETGNPATSGIITLVQETNENVQRGFLTYLPVYHTAMPLTTLDQRKAAFKGWVYSAFRAGDLMKGIIGSADINYDFEIYDGTEMTEAALLFDSDSVSHLSDAHHQPTSLRTLQLEVQGRPWLVYLHTSDAPEGEALLSKFIAMGGVIVDLLLFYVIFAISGLRKRAQHMADKMTRVAKDERQLFRTVIDNIPISIYVRNKSLVATLANKAECEFWGPQVTEEQALEKLNGPLHKYAGDAENLKIMEGIPLKNIERSRKKEDGTSLLFNVAKYPLATQNGEIEGVIAIGSDITEIKRIEEQMQRMQEILMQTSHVAKVGGWEYKEDQQHFTYSDVVADILEVPLTQKLSFHDMLHHYPLEMYRHQLATMVQAAKEGKECDKEFKIRSESGNEKWVRMIIKARTAHNLYGTIQDIHQQKEEQLAFERVKLRLEIAAKGAGIGIWEWNLERNTLTWDQQMYALYGFEKTDLSAAPLPYQIWSDALHPDDKDASVKLTQWAVATQNNYETEFRIILPDGSIRHIRAFGALKLTEEGKPQALIGTNWDSTPQKTLEESLIQSRQQAEMANMAKSDFLANMSHEIRTPLNSIIGFSDLLMRTPMDETQKKYMQSVHYSSGVLLDLINDILDFSKIEAGKLQLTVAKHNLYELAAQVIEMIKFKTQQKKIELLLFIAADVPQMVWMDDIRVKQVLINLLGNAVKFTDSGEIELSISLAPDQPEATGQTNLLFSIRDTGVGIEPKKQKIIFEAFSQADYSTTRKYGGTGLGLSISNQLLALMNTSLRLESQVGKGSTFSFQLLTQAEINSPTANFTSFKSVLVIDGNQRSVQIITQLLAAQQVSCVTGKSGNDALSAYSTQFFDLVIIGYNLPFFNGAEVVQKLRQIKNQQENTPVILLLDSEEEKLKIAEKYPNLGATFYLNKPVTYPSLVNAMEHFNHTSSSNLMVAEPEIVPLTKFEKIKILVADDNPINLILAQSILKVTVPNAEVFTAVNGQDALEKFEGHAPQIILMDIQMPKLSGYEATMAIREKEVNGHVIIIALTAGTVKGEEQRCIEAGMDAYISKPVTADQLKRIIAPFIVTQKQ